jgi:hypothetical protein
MICKITTLVFVAFLVAACSSGASNPGSSAPETSPTVSAPSPQATTPTSQADDFNTAVKFTRFAFKAKYQQAAELTKPESAASRYIVHQAAVDKAQRIDGRQSDEVDYSVDPNKKTGSIRIDYGSDEVYVWKDFTFDQGKVTGWTGPNGPISSVLWTREAKDSGLGATARLVSAYRSNAGNMFAVVQFTAKRDVDLGYMPTYAAKGGYRQNSSDWSSVDELAAGEKTLTWYMFNDAKFGGKLRLKVASATGYSTAILELAIR